MHLINGVRIEPAVPNSLGWRTLTLTKADPYWGEKPGSVGESLINLIQISDTHICDAQSPARVEFLDRYADPHHPMSTVIDSLVGTYRSQEALTTQVLESLLQRIAHLEKAPITGSPIDALVFTGDLVDNAQFNELDWFAKILEGRLIRPDSGNNHAWEGVGGSSYSEHYWNPHGTPSGERDDYPRALYGFPVIPDLLDAVRAPFYGTGATIPWFAVHGNHDSLLQGTVVPDEKLNEIVLGSSKLSDIPDEAALKILQRISEVGPASYPTQEEVTWSQATEDPSRIFLQPGNFHKNLHRLGSRNETLERKDIKTNYWSAYKSRVRLISLDTVNPHGGWQGSIDQQQYEWLTEQLAADRSTPTIILSHHPLQDLVNLYRPDQSTARLGTIEVQSLLLTSKNIFLWLAGHTHRNRITFIGEENQGFWHIETSSLIDWPQQARIVEVFQSGVDEIGIALTMLDHSGNVAIDTQDVNLDDINDLAGLSRNLAINDWQRRFGRYSITHNEGEPKDRNAFLTFHIVK